MKLTVLCTQASSSRTSIRNQIFTNIKVMIGYLMVSAMEWNKMLCNGIKLPFRCMDIFMMEHKKRLTPPHTPKIEGKKKWGIGWNRVKSNPLGSFKSILF